MVTTTIQENRAYPLSPTQHGMLFHHLRDSASGVDVEQIVGRLREPIDAGAFRGAWERLTERHAALRTGFRWSEGERPFQFVRSSAEVPLEIEDWSGAPPERQNRQLRKRRLERRQQGFDLAKPPLFRVDLLRFDEKEHRLLWTFHHSILDGRSFPVALRELFRLYEALRRGEAAELAEPVPFSEHVRWLEEEYETEDDERFWRGLLSGFEASTSLPLSLRTGAESGQSGSVRGMVERRLSERTTDALRELANNEDLTLNTLIQGAWALFLGRCAEDRDVVFGAARAGRGGSVAGEGPALGMYMNTVPARSQWEVDTDVREWLRALRRQSLAVRSHEHTPLAEVQGWSEVPAGEPLFRTLLVYDHRSLDGWIDEAEDWEHRSFRLYENPGYPLVLYGYGEQGLLLRVGYDPGLYDEARAVRVLDHLERILEGMIEQPGRRVADLPVLPTSQRRLLLEDWNRTETQIPSEPAPRQFERQAADTPDRTALIVGETEISYRELNARAEQAAERLRDAGVEEGSIVGLYLRRSSSLVTGLLAVHKAGAAYLPLDPEYPPGRLRFMLEDSGVDTVVTEDALSDRLPGNVRQLTGLCDTRDDGREGGDTDPGRPGTNGKRAVRAADLAYLIYTSGSTGRPKGVMVEHGNLSNFFAAMDEEIGGDGTATWLASTSLSFDISVLELYWTLARGHRVVLHRGRPSELATRSRGRAAPSRPPGDRSPPDIGLFFFAGEEGETGERYELLMDAAEFGDEHGFEAVWTPERHFHQFGGLYPNPSVTGAALAASTARIDIRAGSVVLPLHHPARVAEEWSVVDNLSGGRAGVAFASGWQPEDFLLRPEAYEDRRERTFRGVETVRRLWRGEQVSFPGHDGEPVEVSLHPSPVQDELPVWVTAAGNPDTFRKAGRLGAGVLTHLLGQSLGEVEEKAELYREARREAGYDPEEGRVTLMLHTLLGGDREEVRTAVRDPLLSYLGSSMSLVKEYADSWTAYGGSGEAAEQAEGDEFREIAEEDRQALLENAFRRYFETSGLFGTPREGREMAERVRAAGVDELACLIDFGVERNRVLEGLGHLAAMRRGKGESGPALEAAPEAGDSRPTHFESLVRRHGVTHFQCTPSLARLLMADPSSREAMRELDTLLMGGETFPPDLADELLDVGPRRILNMYGPTETTVWSTTSPVSAAERPMPIGRPVANTRVYVLDREQRPVPLGEDGELWIGGAGVARGYLNRPELTDAAFREDPFVDDPAARMYRTGDRVRFRDDGTLLFLGRSDRQVKIRGHRVEPGEVEAVLSDHDAVRQAAVVYRREGAGDGRLMAYWAAADCPGAEPSPELSAYLKERLPHPMLPDNYVRLDSLPLTPNGKLDRSALPDPGQSGELPEETGPRTAIEERMVKVWCEVLGREKVGVKEDFFEAGGNSLATLQVVARVEEEFGIELRVSDVFDASTVAGLSARVEEKLLSEADDGDLERLLEESDAGSNGAEGAESAPAVSPEEA